MDISVYEIEYREKLRPRYESLATRVSELVDQLIKDAGIPIVQIEHRAKTLGSFLEKLERNSYKDPFKEIKDFAGIRVVSYYNDDVERVADIIRNEFQVDADHSTDKLQELAIDEFAYRSFHLVCTLKEPRIALPEWRPFLSLPFEIQIRSVLQHAWAAISHKLDYKLASQAPQEVRRQLFRLSALLELADLEFATIRDRSQSIAEEYRKEVDKGQLSIPLNFDSLSQYLLEKVDFGKWKKIGRDAGLREPGEEKLTTDIRSLLDILTSMGIKEIAEFNGLIKNHEGEAKQILRLVAEESKKQGYLMRANPVDLLNVLVAIAERDRFPKDFFWPEPWRDELRTTLNQLLDMSKDRKQGQKTETERMKNR